MILILCAECGDLRLEVDHTTGMAIFTFTSDSQDLSPEDQDDDSEDDDFVGTRFVRTWKVSDLLVALEGLSGGQHLDIGEFDVGRHTPVTLCISGWSRLDEGTDDRDIVRLELYSSNCREPGAALLLPRSYLVGALCPDGPRSPV